MASDRSAVDHGPGDGALFVFNRVGGGDVFLRTRDSRFQPIEHSRFAGVSRDEMDGVNRADLADAIDAADSLFEPHRIPRQLEIDDEPAAVVQVQPLAGRVGRQQNPAPAVGEVVERRAPFVARQAAVQHQHRLPKRRAEMEQRVAEFGEDHDRLRDTPEQPPERRHLGFARRGPLRRIAKRAQQTSFAAWIGETQGRETVRRVVGVVELAAVIGERQRQLSEASGRFRTERVETATHGQFERPGARERALVQDRQRQPRVGRSRVRT